MPLERPKRGLFGRLGRPKRPLSTERGKYFFLSRSLKSLRGPCDLLGPLGPLLKSSSPKRPLFGPTRKPKRGLFPQREASLDPSGGHAHIYRAPLATEAVAVLEPEQVVLEPEQVVLEPEKRPLGDKTPFLRFLKSFLMSF